MMGGMMSGTSMIGMCVIGLFLLIFIVGVTIYMVAHLLVRNNKEKDQPLMLLKERYIKGEISEEEYEQKWKVLNKN